ncbi:unnamed protein product [marine sediment metagenome]|uniref:Uncharacterized protein n=1 Tax=marine sediment metagenome TaxID=412755 RepID=X0Y9D4_9ZZZZ
MNQMERAELVGKLRAMVAISLENYKIARDPDTSEFEHVLNDNSQRRMADMLKQIKEQT